MKVYAALLVLFGAGSTFVSANPHGRQALSARHAQLVRRNETDLEVTRKSKRCKSHGSSVIAESSPKKSHPTSTPQPKKGPSIVAPANVEVPPVTIEGLIRVQSSCGPTGATKAITAVSGPNGNIDWLNCGVTGSGWEPSFVTVSDIVTADLTDAVKQPGSPFKACSSFVHLFEQYAGQHGLPAILLASFAMQESSCNPNTVGGAGEQGLMQLTKDKCGKAPQGNCRDPEFNIATGAAYFAATLNGNGGDLLKSIGEYNGWEPGMTVGKATAAAKTGCCRCQNNLDYLHQFLNGWCQNIDAYDHDPRIGKYFNLDACPE